MFSKKDKPVCKNCKYYREFTYPKMEPIPVSKKSPVDPTGYCKKRCKQKRKDDTCKNFELRD